MITSGLVAVALVVTAVPTAAERPPACRADVLAGAVVAVDPGAGQRTATLRVRNTGDQLCTMQGYGRLVLRGPGGPPTRVGQSLPPGPTVVYLPPGATAERTLRWTVIATGDEPETGPCQPESTAIEVTPPGAARHLTVPHTFGSVCDHGRLDTNAWH